MITYDEYKDKVYEIFIRDRLKDVDNDVKIKYLEDSEDFIRESYDGDVFRFTQMGDDKVFTDPVMSGSVCMNLDMLY